MENENVTEVYEVYAPNDLMAKIIVDDLERLRDCVQEIRQIQNISGTTLITALRKWDK
jgi:DNA-binding Lrp family transcriptional regulator